MRIIFCSINSFLLGLVLLTLWHMFFIMEIPYTSIGDASGEFWYQHAYWGLLVSAVIAVLSSIATLIVAVFSTIKRKESSQKTERVITGLLAATTLGAIYGFYVLFAFVYVSS